MTDREIIEEALKLVEDGVCVTLPVKGSSMMPFILGGRDSVVLGKPAQLKPSDIVLAWVDGSRYVLHRLIRIDGNRVTLMGDGNIAGVERCALSDIKAIATHKVNAEGRRIYLYGTRGRLAFRFWYWLRPVRRYLLAIYRRK